MSRSRRLQVLVKLERLREQQSLLRMLAAGQERDKQNKLSEQLANYIDDYSAVNTPANDESVNTRYLSNASRFVGGLQQALVTQRQHCKQVADVFEEKNQNWKRAHNRHKSIERLVESYRAQELREDEIRAEQESEDQWAALHGR